MASRKESQHVEAYPCGGSEKMGFFHKIIIGVNAATEQRPVDGILNSAGAGLFQVEVSGRNRVIDAM